MSILNNTDYDEIDPDDMFKDTRMSFGDHIEDLRTHLIRALIGFAVGMVISLYPLGQYVMRVIVSPVEEQLERFEDRTLEKELLENDRKSAASGVSMPNMRMQMRFRRSDVVALLKEEPPPQPVLDKTVRSFEHVMDRLDLMPMLDEEMLKQHGDFRVIHAEIPDPREFAKDIQRMASRVRRPKLTTMNITEAFMVYFKVALMTGFVLSSPWVFYHVWAFIAAGLYPSEKRLVNVYLPFSLFLFISGVLVCQFLVIPRAIEAMLWFNEWLGLGADLRLNEWLSFALMMPIVFGLSFQTPLVMMFLHKLGLATVQTFRDKRRAAWFVMAIFAALITPSVDAFSMVFLWAPMGLLYELGIILCVYQGEDEDLAEWEIEDRKRGELIEV